MDREKIAHRLALLRDANLTAEEIDDIAGELADLDRVVAELEAFGNDTPWVSQQIQPSGKKA